MNWINKKSISRLFVLVVLVMFICLEANAQIPQMPTMNGFNFGTTQRKQTPVKTESPEAVVVKEETPDSLKQLRASLESSEAELRRMEIQKERILLEAELDVLISKGINSIQDSLNLKIKKENLALMYMKEQLLLKEELMQMAGSREYDTAAVFGHHFFRNGGIKYYQRASDAKPSNQYILGVQDVLHIEVWGYSSISQDLEIGSDGYANLPFGQKVYLRGLTLEKAKSLIKRKMASLADLRSSSLDISVVKYRTITVHVIGEVYTPGSFVIPAINTAFNALTMMGGPTNIGSVRSIYIKREGEIIDSLDVYDYMLNPKKSKEVYLQDNDYIIVEPLGSVVTVSGALRREGAYEVKSNETLEDLINIAAGINATTYLEDVFVNRIIDNKYYKQISLNYDSLLKVNGKFKLLNGDEIEFKEIADDESQVLRIYGAVNIPGMYKVSNKSSIRDLVLKANGLRLEAYKKEAFLIRTNDDFTKSYLSFDLEAAMSGSAEAIEVKPYDEIYIFSLKNYILDGEVEIKGAVMDPQSMVFADNMSIRDLIFISGGLKPESYMERGVLIRTNEQTNEKQTIVFNVNEVVNTPASGANLVLQRLDVVEIFSKIEMRDSFIVKIDGEVHKPGEFDFSQNMTLKDLFFMAGGLKTSAINSKIEIVRSFKFGEDLINLVPIKAEIIVMEIGAVLELKEEFDNFIIYPYDQVSIRKNPDYLIQRKVTLSGAVLYPGEYTLLSEDERLASVINRAGGLRAYAFPKGLEFSRLNLEGERTNVITDLNKALKNKNSSYNYIMFDQDSIHIPVASGLVGISGNIMSMDKELLSVYYKKHRRARHYVMNYAGGFDERTQKRKTYVKYADGTAKKAKNFLFFNVYPKPRPGSEIVVVKNPKPRKGVRLGSSVEDTTVKITAIMSLVLMYALIKQSF